MEARAKALGHAVHPMLIVFPLGLLATAVIFDILHLITDRQGFAVAAGYMIAAGIIGGVVAAVPGLVDWLAIPAGTRAKRIGALHGIGNVVVLVLFAISWLLRTDAGWDPGAFAIILGFAGLAVSGVTGWLGGELVDRLGVGVDEDAHLDAPSSLRRTAAARATPSNDH
jgi:uncharacterized membrane protein